MIAHPAFGSPSFKLVAKGLVELHRLIKDGRDDSPEAEAVRDALDAPLRALNRIEKERDVAIRAPDYEMTIGILGICHELLGNSSAAVNYFTRGLQVNPNNTGLLVARGIQLYGTSPRAISDFEQAVKLRSPVVWPYLFLAHHYLATSRFEECRLMCDAGLRTDGSDSVKSQLEEWRAIAQAELGFPPESVRASFEAALRLDPSNELAKRNQDAFEASLSGSRTSPRSMWERKSEATVRQFGLAERRYSVAASSHMENRAAQIDWNLARKTLRPDQEWFDGEEPKPF